MSSSLFSYSSSDTTPKDSGNQKTCRFSEFWDAWHGKRKKAKTFAKKAFNKLSDEDQELAIQQAKVHTKMFEELAERFGDEILESMKYPQGWLNQHRFKQPYCGVHEFIRNGADLANNKEERMNPHAVDAYYRTC